MGEINIGDVTARLRLDATGLQQGMQQAQQAFAQFASQMQSSIQGLQGFGRAKDVVITNLGQFQQALQRNTQTFQQFNTQINQTTNNFQQHNTQINQLTQTYQTYNSTLNQTIVVLNEAGQAGQRASSGFSFLQGVFQVASGIGLATSIQGIVAALKDFVTASVTAGARLEQLRAQFTALQGAQAAQATLETLFRTAQRLGVEFGPLAQGFRQFEAATRGTALEGVQAERVFTQIVTGMRAMGTTSEQVSRALLALQQMVSKGTVSQEELRQQLGEALPGAMNIAARALGVTTAELNKLIEKGMDATTFVRAFGNQIEQEFGGKAATATNTLTSAWQRFLNELERFEASMASGGLMNGLRDLVNASAKLLENMRKAREEQERSLGGPATAVPEDVRGMSPEITARQQRINDLRGFLQEPGLGGVLVGRERMEQYRQELLELQRIQRQAIETLQKGLQGEAGAYQGYTDPVSQAQERMQKLLEQGRDEIRKIDLSPFLTDTEKADEQLKSWDKTLKAVNDEFQKLGEGLRRTLLPTERRTPFDELITQIAGEKNLDPILMRALVEQESGFNPQTRSRAGALGLLQLMPGTARTYGAGGQEFDPAANLRAGMSYFADLLKQFNGSVEKALTAYNAGPAGGGIPQRTGENATFAQEVLARRARMTGDIPGQLESARRQREALQSGAEAQTADAERRRQVFATGREYLRALDEEERQAEADARERRQQAMATGREYLRALDEEMRKREQANESLKRLERQYSMTADARKEDEAARIAAQYPQDEEIQARAKNVQLLIEEREAMMSTFNAIKARTDAQREALQIEERSLQTARERLEESQSLYTTGGPPFGESRELIRLRQRLDRTVTTDEGKQESEQLLQQLAAQERLNYYMGLFQDLANSVGNAWTNALMSIADGTKTVAAAFKEMARSILQSMAQIASQEAFKALIRIGFGILGAAFGGGAAIGGGTSLATTGGSGGFIAGMGASSGGQGGFISSLTSGGGLAYRQHGGWVNRPTLTMLGERGPELVSTQAQVHQMQAQMRAGGRSSDGEGGVSVFVVDNRQQAERDAVRERAMGREVIIREVVSEMGRGESSQILGMVRRTQR